MIISFQFANYLATYLISKVPYVLYRIQNVSLVMDSNCFTCGHNLFQKIQLMCPLVVDLKSATLHVCNEQAQNSALRYFTLQAQQRRTNHTHLNDKILNQFVIQKETIRKKADLSKEGS